MKRYSIRDIEKLTGIKKHTLRIWEQRYEFLEPHRTDANIRFYDDEHLRKLLNITLLVNNRYKISQLSKLSPNDISKEVKKSYETITEHPDQSIELLIKELIECTLELDEKMFEKLFTMSLIKRGLEKTITEVVFPFIERMGIMWRTGDINTGQEHFMYFLIRQKIIVAIDAIPIAPEGAPVYLVFLPESDFDDLFILLSIYLIKNKGNKIINLGQDISLSDIQPISDKIEPKALLTFITSDTNYEDLQGYVNALKSTFGDSHVLVGGRDTTISNLNFPEKIIRITTLKDLYDYLSD